MKVDINKDSGFCFGVVRAIQAAEKQLETHTQMYCLGDMVHNEMELDRLKQIGLKTIGYDQFKKLKNARVIIRAHGEPPETYTIAEKNNIELIDATCPIVLKLQSKIKKTPSNHNVIIYGNSKHPEVIGLVRQLEKNVFVVSDREDLEHVPFDKPVFLYAQTTKDKDHYEKIQQAVKEKLIKNDKNPDEYLIINNSICHSVHKRKESLATYVKKKDLVIFVGGTKSSNAKILFDICKTHNKNAHFIQNIDDINDDWLTNVDTVGIAGATSTPLWLLENIAKYIRSFKTN